MSLMTGDAQEGKSHSDWRKRAVYAAIIAAIIIVLLLLRTCRSRPDEKFDYFRAKAADLKDDPSAIAKFVTDDVKTLDYRGNVKGALGTLWNKAGSPEEKKLLADALMHYAKGAHAMTIDDVSPSRDKTADGSADANQTFSVQIVHRVIKASDKDETAPIDTPIYSGPVADLIGDVHTVQSSGALKTTFILRGKSDASRLVKDVTLPQDAMSEQIVFTYSAPTIGTKVPPSDQAGVAAPAAANPPPTQVVRELWHTGNRVGAEHPTPGDRHDFVVLPCRVDKFVREKEEQILKEHQRDQSPEVRGYLMLLDYALKSDRALAGLEKHRQLTAQFNKPRILILSQYVADDMPGKIAWALDLRANEVSFNGAFAPAYLATQARSFIESGLEQTYLARTTGIPSTSTFDVFSRLKDDYPNTCARRLVAIRRTLADLESFSAINASATFAVHVSPGSKWQAAPQVVVTRAASGSLHLKGPKAYPKFIERLASTPGAARIKQHDSCFEDDFTTPEDCAVAVETALLSADVSPGVAPDYVLESQLNRGDEPLVEPGAQFVFSWGEGDDRTDQRIYVKECGEGLNLNWRVQTGPMPAAGTRQISGAALASATIHNPWYRAGPGRQEDATSFCVSREVYRQISAGKAVLLSVQARMSDKDDPLARRPVEYTAPLTPVGRGTHDVTINGRKSTIRVINCRLKDNDVAVLDDPTFPVGMADKLTNIVTGVRARLVDETGVPISGAKVTVTAPKPDGGATPIQAEVETSGDGSMRLPPPLELESGQTSYGKASVEVKVSPNDEPIETAADFTNPGLQTVEIKITRPRPKLMYFTSSNAGNISDLAVSDQVKRHARRDAMAGELVVIPDRMVSDGIRSYIGYYACDRATGYYVGVTEDGLNGSNAWQQAVATAVQAAYKARKDFDAKTGATAPLQMFRGAVISWWTYCSDRLAGDSNKQALIDTLQAMQAWAKATNMSTYISAASTDFLGSGPGADKLTGDLTAQFTKLINSGIANAEGDTATAAFEIGYISGTAGLAAMIGDDDSD